VKFGVAWRGRFKEGGQSSFGADEWPSGFAETQIASERSRGFTIRSVDAGTFFCGRRRRSLVIVTETPPTVSLKTF